MTTTHKPLSTLDQVRPLIDQGDFRKALDVLERTRDLSPGAENARAVCLMRLGHPDAAVSIFQRLLLHGGVTIRDDASDLHIINFATALFLTQNPRGALDALDELHQPDAPAALQLRTAITRWRKSLNILQRLAFIAYGTAPNKPVLLDFPPGQM